MSLVHGFISELIRSANETGRLQAAEKKRLLERAVHTIRDMREQIGVEPDKAPKAKAMGGMRDNYQIGVRWC